MLARLVELQILPVLDGVVQAPLTACHVGQLPLGINVYVHGLFFLELLDALLLTGHPPGRYVADRLEGHLDAVFVFQAVHDHLELQQTHRPDSPSLPPSGV